MGIQEDILNETPLKYQEVRPLVQSGDILLCSGTKLFSKLIQTSTKSPWSHVGFLMRMDPIDRIMVLESVESIGVRAVPLSSYVWDYEGKGKGYPGRLVIARHSGMKEEILPRLSRFAVDLLGYPYDNDQIAKIAGRIMLAATKMKKQFEHIITPDKEFICSEYVDVCFKSVGIRVDWDKDGFISPDDFARDPNISVIAPLAVSSR